MTAAAIPVFTGMTNTNKTDIEKQLTKQTLSVFHKTDEVCCLLVCHSRVFNICSSLAACTRVSLSGGNPRLLKNFSYIAFLKEIMLETILILNMDPRFREDDSGGYSHFHGNDKHKQNRHACQSHKTDEVCLIFMAMTDTNKTDTGANPIKQTKSVPFSWQ
jgi:hypothetical protein